MLGMLGRFIPTRVGNTLTLVAICPGATVHPHACGEHLPSPPGPLTHHGSSPRVWGTRPMAQGHATSIRFIPTRVGNTGAPPQRPACPAVHPHACGEHQSCKRRLCKQSGSSPRVWGTRRKIQPIPASLRFIPTRVGNTIFGRYGPINRAVHPHACGEHCCYSIATHKPCGSSPRVWGTRFEP